MRTIIKKAATVALAAAALFSTFAHAGAVKFQLKASPEPLRATMDAVLTLAAYGADGAQINLADPARVKHLTLKTISGAANDIREYTPAPSEEKGAVQVAAGFTFGGQYSVVIDGEVDSAKVHDLLFLFVAGPEDSGN